MSAQQVSVQPAGGRARVSATATYRRLLGYTRRYWGIALLTVVAMIADAACMGVFARTIKPMLDNLFVERDPHTIFWMPIIIIAIFCVRGLATFVTDFGTAFIGRGVVQQLRVQLFDHYLRLPSAFFDQQSSGHQIARITYSSEQVAQATTDAVKVSVVDGLSVVFYITVMLLASVPLTLTLLVMVPLIAALVYFVGVRYRRISRRIQGSMGEVTGMVEEAVGAHREVKVYGAQAYESERFDRVAEQTRRLNLKVATTNGMSTSFVQMIAAASLALIVLFATRPAMLATLSAGSFTSLILAMGGILPSLKRLTTVQANLQRGVAAAEEIFAVLDAPAEADRGTQVLENCRGEIEFRDVRLQYPQATQPALAGVDLVCPRGSMTALVGRSGSGKTSLVGLLPRFYDATGGAVLVDGQAVTEYTLASLRRQIALVSQQVVLFNDTVARNIAYGALGTASEAEIVAAAEAANAMEFIRRLPQGIHSPVGQGGALLSGGQRQRIAIARALLKNAPILILDEATSALDTESERLIQEALARLMASRTTLVVAHRLSTVEHADQIVVLDQGRIVERGRHAELVARNGHYAALYKMQFHDAAA